MIRPSSYAEWADVLVNLVRCDIALPANIAAEGAKVVGFSDEAMVRQDPDGLSAIARACRNSGDSGFFIVWAGLRDNLKDGDGAFVDINSLDACADLLELANSLDPELCFRDRWVAFSPEGAWAIYAEQYGAELAVFVTSGGLSADYFFGGSLSLLSVPQVIDQLIPASAEGKRFASSFASAYTV